MAADRAGYCCHPHPMSPGRRPCRWWWVDFTRDTCGTERLHATPGNPITAAHPSPASRPVQPAERRRFRQARLHQLRRGTRAALVRIGLLRRASGAGQRPSPGLRRRSLALATSTGLAAPLLALDGLPGALAPPVPVPWDELAHGSVTMAADAVQPLERLAPGLIAAHGEEAGLLRVATPWVRAAGVEGRGVATPSQVREAGELLEVETGDAVDRAAVLAVRQGVMQRTEPVASALGLSPPGEPVSAEDVRATAQALSVPAPNGITPDVVDAVVATGDEVVADRIEQTVVPYAEALGLDVGRRPDPADTRAVAAELGLELPDVPDATAAEQLHHAWLQTLRPYFSRIGVHPGGRVDPADLVALARALGADVGETAGPAEVSVLLAALDDPAFVPPLVGHIGEAELHLPSRDVLVSGWHEAAGPTALPMEPAATGPAVELPTRGRPYDQHAALDVAVAPGTQAVAPVAGTVVEVTPYMLYGSHPDTRIVIQPDDAPHLGVAVLHVSGPLVSVGDHVAPGDPLASHATQFPFSSQIERLTGRTPHIHVEVKAAAT